MTNNTTDDLRVLQSIGSKRTPEQEETINQYLGDLEFELEIEVDVESTLELPQIRESNSRNRAHKVIWR